MQPMTIQEMSGRQARRTLDPLYKAIASALTAVHHNAAGEFSEMHTLSSERRYSGVPNYSHSAPSGDH